MSDTRRDRPSNRRRQLQDVTEAQAASGLADSAQPSSFRGVEDTLWQWVSTLRELYDQYQALEIAMLVDDVNLCGGGDDKERVADTNRLRRRLEEARKTARATKSVCEGITQAAKERHRAEVDSGPNTIELIGVEAMRAQLTSALKH